MKKMSRITAALLCILLAFGSVVSVGGASSSAALTGEGPLSSQITKFAAETGEKVTEVSSVEQAIALLTQEAETHEKTHSGECNGDCEFVPSIIIPGIGQSQTFLYENDEIKIDKNGDKITGWPLYVEVEPIVKTLLVPLMKMLITQKDNGFSDAAAKAVKEAFYVNAMDKNGKNIEDVRVMKYPYSLAECNEDEQNYIYNCIPIQAYAEIAGEDHLYFFAYNSFGNNLEIAEELSEMIKQVKEDTGHDKVNIVPISLGGTIANTLLEYYKELYSSLNKVIFVVPALDGSVIIGDVFMGTLSTSDEMLYKELIPTLMENDYTSYIINLAIRIIPKKVLLDTLDKVVASLTDTVLVNCTTMWSLVPSAYYEAARERLLTGSENDEIRRQTDMYYEAQKNSRKNILALKASGCEVFDIVDYDMPIYCIVPSYADYNADGIIQLDSASMGAYAINNDVKLPADYVQKNTNCSSPGSHNHISPDGVVDASCGILPEHTFYFYKQHHEGTGRNDVIMKLVTELLTNNEFKDVYSLPSRFPQFNVGRETKGLMRSTLPNAKRLLDSGELDEAEYAKLDAAIKEAEAMLDETVVDYKRFENAKANLDSVLIEVDDNRNPPEDDTLSKVAEVIFRLASEMVYKYFGPRGFSDPRGT